MVLPVLAMTVIALGGVTASGHLLWLVAISEGVRAAIVAATPALGVLVLLPILRDRSPAARMTTGTPRLPQRRTSTPHADRLGPDGIQIIHDPLVREAVGAPRQHRHLTERQLREQLRNGSPELQLRYQPVVHARGRLLHGVEALARWRTASGAEIPPDEFIPIAESSDLVIEFDRWVMTTALCQFARWRRLPGTEHLELAVNVSGRHVLDPRFVGNVLGALDAAGVDPRHLTVEITETALIWDLDVARHHLKQLRSVGIRVALDDFGTGFANVSLLQGLPVDVLKIDRSFTARAAVDGGRPLVQMLGDLGGSLGLRTVAEGVETEHQAAAVRDVGIDLLQGFLFGAAQTAEQCSTWIDDRWCHRQDRPRHSRRASPSTSSS